MNDETFEEIMEDAAEAYKRENKAWEQLLCKLEDWTEELATRGPKAMPDVYREMAVTVNPKDSEPEPFVDFEHQKGYK